MKMTESLLVKVYALTLITTINSRGYHRHNLLLSPFMGFHNLYKPRGGINCFSGEARSKGSTLTGKNSLLRELILSL